MIASLLLTVACSAPFVLVPIHGSPTPGPHDAAIRAGVTAALKGTEQPLATASTEGRQCALNDNPCLRDLAHAMEARLILVPQATQDGPGCSFTLTVLDTLSALPAAVITTPSQKDCASSTMALRDAAQAAAQRALKFAADHPHGTFVDGGVAPVAAPVGKGGGGGLSKEEISGVMGKAMPTLRQCYLKQLALDPELEGTVVVRFTVAPDGKTLEVGMAQNTVPDAAVGTCVLQAIGKVRFPPPRGGSSVSVVYPLVFEADD